VRFCNSSAEVQLYDDPDGHTLAALALDVKVILTPPCISTTRKQNPTSTQKFDGKFKGLELS
jgi:hypothetical protein